MKTTSEYLQVEKRKTKESFSGVKAETRRLVSCLTRSLADGMFCSSNQIPAPLDIRLRNCTRMGKQQLEIEDDCLREHRSRSIAVSKTCLKVARSL